MAERHPNIYFSTLSDQIRAALVWTDDDGDTHGSLDLSEYSDIVFHDPQQARAAMGALADLAEAMDAEIARFAAEGKEAPRIAGTGGPRDD
jgi:hypothetical protein